MFQEETNQEEKIVSDVFLSCGFATRSHACYNILTPFAVCAVERHKETEQVYSGNV